MFGILTNLESSDAFESIEIIQSLACLESSEAWVLLGVLECLVFPESVEGLKRMEHRKVIGLVDYHRTS